MRVVHVTDVYLPRLGGVELQVRDLATHQRLRGDSSLVLTTTAPGDDQAGDHLAGGELVGGDRAGNDRAGNNQARNDPALNDRAGDHLAGGEVVGGDRAGNDRAGNNLAGGEVGGGDRAGDDLAGGVPVLRLGAMRRASAGPYRPVSAAELTEVLRSCAAELVHVHISAFSPLSWTAARVAAAVGLPTVISVHSMWHDILPLVRRYARRHRAADWPVAWTAVSTAAAEAVSAALDGAVVGVLPNGIDPAEWQTARPPSEPRVPTVVSVMRMVRRKRPRALLDILIGLQQSHPGRFRAVLVGDGPQLPRLRRRADAAGAGNGIQFAGQLTRPAIRTVLATADLYIAPAPRESFGIAALEARTAGLPVVARSGSGIADFIRPGVEGWLADSDAMLAATLADLLDDPAQLTAVAEHNRTTTPAMNWPATLDTADAVYDTAIRLRTRPPARHPVGTPE